MSEEELARKLRRAAHLILFQHHRYPGAKGWELRKVVGRDYMKVIKLLREKLSDLGLDIKIVSEEGEDIASLSEMQLDKARFYVVSKHPLTLSEAALAGWRLDSLAVLAVTISFIASRHGKAPKKEVEKMLSEKFPEWKVSVELDRFIKKGYLSEDEEEVLYLGWRTKAEVDLKALLENIAGGQTS